MARVWHAVRRAQRKNVGDHGAVRLDKFTYVIGAAAVGVSCWAFLLADGQAFWLLLLGLFRPFCGR